MSDLPGDALYGLETLSEAGPELHSAEMRIVFVRVCSRGI